MLHEPSSVVPLGFVQLNQHQEIIATHWSRTDAIQAELDDWKSMPWDQWLKHAFLSSETLPLATASESGFLMIQQGVYHQGSLYRWEICNHEQGACISLAKVCQEHLVGELRLEEQGIPGQAEKSRLGENAWLDWLLPGWIHDANNHLIGLSTLTQWLKQSIHSSANPEEKDLQNVELAHEYASSAQKMLQQLNTCLHQGSKASEVHWLEAMMKDCIALLRIGFPNCIQWSLRADTSENLYQLSWRDCLDFVMGSISACFPRPNTLPSGWMELHLEPDSKPILHDASESVPPSSSRRVVLELRMSQNLKTAACLPSEQPVLKGITDEKGTSHEIALLFTFSDQKIEDSTL